MPWTSWLLLLAFLIGSAPLVWQDLRYLSVSPLWLGLVLVGWVAASVGLTPGWAGAAALSAGVFTVGTLVLLALPGSLGEADVVYLGALAWLLPFWGLILAAGLACVLGLGFFWVLSGVGRRDVSRVPMPFLPCLVLGALGAWGVGL